METPLPVFNFQPTLGTYVDENVIFASTSFYYALTATRSVKISSTIKSGRQQRHMSWSQRVSYSNIQNMTDFAYSQYHAIVTSGSHSSSVSDIVSSYTYPMNLFSAYKVQSEGECTNPGSVLALSTELNIVMACRYYRFLRGYRPDRGSL